ncbi:MAG: His/Gly/Thr/Pro-type tRNA ligase C-terminal domain-containing protein, partial [Candidatus Micrarchaeota archaeon]
GIWRMMAALAGVHGDSKGLIFPFAVAPLQAVVVPIFRKDEERKEVMDYSGKALAALKEAGIAAALDGSDKSPGYKYNFWELKGVPVRVEIGPKEVKEGMATLVRRTGKEKASVGVNELARAVEEQGRLLTGELRGRSKKILEEAVKDASSKEGVRSVLDAKGIARAFFCSFGMDGKPCADELKDFTTGGKVRGRRIDGKEGKEQGKCVVCGKPSGTPTYIARQY